MGDRREGGSHWQPTKEKGCEPDGFCGVMMSSCFIFFKGAALFSV